MELCLGSLRGWLQKRNQMETEVTNRLELYDWFKQICNGLEYIHQFGDNGMIHRDIKPDNILFSKEQTIKIGDLGLTTENPYNTHTVGVGTKLYRPQEQDDKSYGKSVDIFPLGKLN